MKKLRKNFMLFIFILILIYETTADMTENSETDIEDVILDLNPSVVLNLDTPENTHIGTIIVLTYSRRNYNTLYINSDDPYFILISEKLYLRGPGAKLLQNIYSILLAIYVTDLNDPPGLFTKYIRIPVEHIKEDSVLKVDMIDNLCDTDSNRRLFSLSILDPIYNPKEPNNCRISYTNYPNIKFVIYRINNTEFHFYLPPLENNFKSLFDIKKNGNLVIEVICTSNFIVTHKRTIDLRICKTVNKIKDIKLDVNNYEDMYFQFDWPINFFIAKLKVIDSPQKSSDNYEFSLGSPNEFLDVSPNGEITLKQMLKKNLLKYTDPKITLKVKVADKYETSRDIEKVFKFKINATNQEVPFLRFRSHDPLAPIWRFAQAQDDEVLFKLGQFELDQIKFPRNRFDIRLISQNGNVSVDDEGNLYLIENPSKKLNNSNNNANVTIDIFDNTENNVVFEDVFDIELPPGPPNNTTTPQPTKPATTVAPNNILECVNDKDCNRVENGPNKCLKLSSIKDQNIKNLNDAENFLRRLQFISNKDPSIFLKYNLIIQALISPNKELFEILLQNSISSKELYEIGICLCDQDSKGFKCNSQVENDKPHQCYRNSSVPACNPKTSICQPSEFLLRNKLRTPTDRINEYKSYYCECTKEGTVGVNCEYQKDQCKLPQKSSFSIFKRQVAPFLSDPIRRYPVSTLGSVDNNVGKCDPNNKEFCLPLLNSTDGYKCVKQENKCSSDFVNYLVFDQSNKNPNFIDDPTKPNDKFNRLNLSDASVAIGIQNFIRDEVLPRYSYKNYAKVPKGPLAIMKPSIFMPQILNDIRDRINRLISQNDSRANDVLDKLTSNRVQQLVQDTLLYLISSQKLSNKVVLEGLKTTIEKLINKLNFSDIKNLSSPLWSLMPNQIYGKDDLTTLIINLNALKNNTEKIDNSTNFREILSLSANNELYLDLFNFSNRPYSLLKLDILPGIYIEADGELTLRPTPGIFLESIPKDKATPDRELLFLPGIFNPASSSDCSVKSIFQPGIMSLPIDNYDISNLPNDANKYLNKFIPMQLPFNINGFLTPLRLSVSDTISALLTQENVNNNITDFRSYLLMTPLDLNPDSSLDIILKNEKFISNLFSPDSLYRVIKNQTLFDTPGLASTLVLSDPTMLAVNKQNSFNYKCFMNGSNMSTIYRPKGAQFYNQINPVQNVSVVPFIFYDEDGQPIPKDVVEKALQKYCDSYKVVINEFHARICEALNRTNQIREAQKNNSSLFQNCSFSQLAYEYYNPQDKKTPDKNKFLPLIIIGAILGLLSLLSLLLLCCYCCKCCPLAAFLARRKKKGILESDSFTIINNSSKINGGIVSIDRFVDFTHSEMGRGDLTRSALDDQNKLKFITDSPETPRVIAMNAKEKVFKNEKPFVSSVYLPLTANVSLVPKYDKDNLIIGENFPITDSTILIKQPKKVSSFASSGLVFGNPNTNLNIPSINKQRPSIIISSRVKGKSFTNMLSEIDDVDESKEDGPKKIPVFIAKRIPRAFSLDYINSRENDSNNKNASIPLDLKSSISFPYINNKSFYRSHTETASKTSLNDSDLINIDINDNSYMIDENEFYREFTARKSNDSLVNKLSNHNLDPNLLNTTNNLFQLKRLSHHIVNPANEVLLCLPSTPSRKQSKRKSQIVDQELTNNNNDPLLFKLHRIESDYPKSFISKDQNNLDINDKAKSNNTGNYFSPNDLKVIRIENSNKIANDLPQRPSNLSPNFNVSKSKLAPNELDQEKSINNEIKEHSCFVCNKNFVSDLISSSNHNFDEDPDDLLYICDACHNEWNSGEKKIYEESITSEISNQSDQSYTYYVVKSRKKTRTDSEDSIIDVININNNKTLKNTQLPETIRLKLGDIIKNDKQHKIKPTQEKLNDNSINSFKNNFKNDNSKFKSNLHSLFKNKHIIVAPAENDVYFHNPNQIL